MGRRPTKAANNVYCRARLEGAKYNDKLLSRESAAERLGLHPSTLDDYELGLTKAVPVDRVVAMAELYRTPWLKNYYCKNCCPIGCDKTMATEVKDIQDIVVNLISLLNKGEVGRMINKLTDIAADKVISSDEVEEFEKIVELFKKLELKIDEISLLYETIKGLEKGDSEDDGY